MNMNYRSLTLSILLGMIVHFAVEAQTLPEKQFFHPDRVKYDKDCFTIEGKDFYTQCCVPLLPLPAGIVA